MSRPRHCHFSIRPQIRIPSSAYTAVPITKASSAFAMTSRMLYKSSAVCKASSTSSAAASKRSTKTRLRSAGSVSPDACRNFQCSSHSICQHLLLLGARHLFIWLRLLAQWRINDTNVGGVRSLLTASFPQCRQCVQHHTAIVSYLSHLYSHSVPMIVPCILRTHVATGQVYVPDP